MPWPLIVFPPDVTFDARPPVGACYYEDGYLGMREALAPRYLALPEPRRLPIVVELPGVGAWCIDTRPRNKDGWYGDGWQVIGDLADPKSITISPSINFLGLYHGWLQAGVISDDCEGRSYDATGRLVRA